MNENPQAVAKMPQIPQAECAMVYKTAALTSELLRELSQAALLPELISMRQTRSQETAVHLIEAGRHLLKSCSLEDLSVQSVCTRANTTIGAFYNRFESKESFFVTLQRLQIVELKSNFTAFLGRHSEGKPDVQTICEEMVLLLVGHFRAHLGVMRASLENASRGACVMLRAAGEDYRESLARAVGPQLPAMPGPERKLRIMFAYQAAVGVLVHTTLNEVGPIKLFDERLEFELVRLITHYLAE